MLDPSKRFITIVLGLGVIVLLAAIAVGERAGNRVIGQVTEKRLESIAPVTVTPSPVETGAAPYGPNWKRSEVMSAASDPGFPDPRVPPQPLPTQPPPPTHRPQPFTGSTPAPTATPNLNLPIWRRLAPLPTASPPQNGQPSPPLASASPQASQTPPP